MTARHGPEGNHDWHSAEYVDHWIGHDLTRDDERRPHIRDMMRHAPFASDASLEVVDIGAGYGVVAEEALKAFPNARVTLLDYSEPMLERARQRLAQYADRLEWVMADLSTPSWTEGLKDRYHLAVSGLAIHNLMSQRHLQDIYKEVFSVLKPDGAFLDYDLVSFSGGLEQHLEWLRLAGFGSVECPWNDGTPAVLVGRVMPG
jgi:ubiquinone/menaquinone biosynthesis C-methylase UbiE